MTERTTWTLARVELRRISMPLVAPFRTSFGSQTERDILLVRCELESADGQRTEGWGECVALSDPSYSPEYVDGAQHVMIHHLLPRLVAGGPLDAADVAPRLAKLHGHPMAKGALEMAVLDAQLRAENRSFADFLGVTATRIPSGVSVGIHDTIDELLATVQGYVDDGYVRIKLKIEPGYDIEQVAAVRDLIGPDTPFQVDANTAYRRTDGAHLRRLDDFDLLLIEQPLPEHDIIGHARARRRDRHADLPRRVARVGRRHRRRDRARSVRDRQHQAGPRGRLPRGGPDPRPVCRQGHSGVVRRDVGDGNRPGRERRPRRPARFHTARRHQRIDPLLRRGHRHRADRDHRRPRHGADVAGARLRGRFDHSRLVHHGYSPGLMTHPFLSEEWMAEAKAIREKYADQVPAVTAVIRINQVVTDVPFGDGEVRSFIDTSDGAMSMEIGELPDADATITTDYDTAKALFVDQDQAATMQAFMSGKIKVQGDMMKIMSMQTAIPSNEVTDKISEEIKSITA